jgi:hypothetical protein
MKARENPFRSERVLAFRTRPSGFTWDGLLEALAARGGRGALVGPHGSGKTTLLEDLAPRLAARGRRVRWVRLDDRAPAPAPLGPVGPDDAVLVDGAEVLGTAAWLRLRFACRRAGALVITAHRPGRLPTLLRCAPRAEIVEELVRFLAPDDAAALLPAARALFARHGGNVRETVRALYDRAADV